MRRSTGNGNAPTTKKGQTKSQKEDSAKKLVQARLPFKILAPGTSPSGPDAGEQDERAEATSITDKARRDARKRKLAYETDEDKPVSKRRSLSKENLELTSKKAKLTTDAPNEPLDDVVVVIDDDNHKEELAHSDEEVKKQGKTRHTPLRKTAKGIAKTVKGAGTPKDASTSQGKGSASKVLIKLPLSGGKNKRRKTTRKVTRGTENVDDEKVEEHSECSDDIEHIAQELNPQKRLKREEAKNTVAQNKVIELIELESEADGNENNMPDSSNKSLSEQSESTSSSNEKSDDDVEILSHTKTSAKSVSAKENTGDVDVTDEESAVTTSDSQDSQSSSDAVCIVEQVKEQTKMVDPKLSALEESKVVSHEKKPLTPKQIKLVERRRQAREEKERKLQEERQQKQREKEEKELARKREREDREEQRRKEREEKDELKKKERDEKERKRLAEVETKNEEKRRRNEAKEEELRKKEDERKRKEQEKEEAELKQKKAAEGFKKFFVPKEAREPVDKEAQQRKRENGSAENSVAKLAFRPFQIKGDMALAPICRKMLGAADREKLEALVRSETELSVTKLYLSELKTGVINPGKYCKPTVDAKIDDDVYIIEDELERAGLAIVEETHGPVEHFRAKFFKFHENRRPPYYGTWRKQTSVVTSRRPLVQDKKYFDYEVDSDLEWEEEEPGESLDGSDDEKDKESEDDEYEVDNEWFVPHGHLSEEELQNEDECGIGADNNREAQKAKLKILQQDFAQEMKKKTEKIKPRLLGCIWVDENGNQPELCPKIIWETLNVRAMLFTVPPIVDEPEEIIDKSEPGSPSTGNGNGVEKTAEKLKPMALSEQMLKQLVRLVHGNRNSKVFLIKEFIAYVAANEEAIKNGDAREPLKSMVREKIEEFAEWQVTETQSKKKKKNKKCLCWVVSNEMLQRLQLQDLSLHNIWHYTLQPKITNTTTDVGGADEEQANAEVRDTKEKDAAGYTEMTKYTKQSSASENAQQLYQGKTVNQSRKKRNTRECRSETAEKAVTEPAAAPTSKKRVPLLMSVPRGEQFPDTAKNALISQFLTKSSNESKKPPEDKEVAHKNNNAVKTAQTEEEPVIVLD